MKWFNKFTSPLRSKLSRDNDIIVKGPFHLRVNICLSISEALMRKSWYPEADIANLGACFKTEIECSESGKS